MDPRILPPRRLTPFFFYEPCIMYSRRCMWCGLYAKLGLGLGFDLGLDGLTIRRASIHAMKCPNRVPPTKFQGLAAACSVVLCSRCV